MLHQMDQGEKSFLPHCYNPSSLDVICGRGVEYFNHSGNKNFRQTISNHLDRYTSAKTKFEKSSIVIEVANEARLSHGQPCRFVRWCYEQQRWYEISREAVRQKVGQTLRETLMKLDPKKKAVKNSKRAMNKAIRLGKVTNKEVTRLKPSAHSPLTSRTARSGTEQGMSNNVEEDWVHSQDIQNQPNSTDKFSFPQVQIGSGEMPFSLMLPSTITSREANTGYHCNQAQSCLFPIGLMSVLKNEDTNWGFHDEGSDESELSSVGWFEEDNFIQDIEHS